MEELQPNTTKEPPATPIITDKSWQPTTELTFNEWAAIGKQLGRAGRACQWWIGDWLNFGAPRYGEKYAQAVEITGYDIQTLANMAWVAGRYTPSRRRENLSWSHHQELATLDEKDQNQWLDIAEQQKLGVHKLRAAIKPPRQTEDPTEHQNKLVRALERILKDLSGIYTTENITIRYDHGQVEIVA